MGNGKFLASKKHVLFVAESRWELPTSSAQAENSASNVQDDHTDRPPADHTDRPPADHTDRAPADHTDRAPADHTDRAPAAKKKKTKERADSSKVVHLTRSFKLLHC